MKQIALSVALVTLIILLAGILVVLIQINRQGFTINVTGAVSLVDAETGAIGDVNLTMPEPVRGEHAPDPLQPVHRGDRVALHRLRLL